MTHTKRPDGEQEKLSAEEVTDTMTGKKILTALIPLAIVLLVWQAASQAVFYFRGTAFPTPWQTFERLAALFAGNLQLKHSLYVHIIASLKRWLIGFSIAASLGIAYGLLAGRSSSLEKATAGIPQMLLLVPGLAWIPVAILLFGIGESSTVFMIAVSAFAPVAINVLAGIKGVDVHLIQAAQMMGSNKNNLFFKVLIPAALPSILSGLRVGLGTGWRVLVAAEMVVGTGVGLGYAIIQARWTLDYESSFACIVVICAIGLLVDYVLLGRLEVQTVRRWAPAEEKQ